MYIIETGGVVILGLLSWLGKSLHSSVKENSKDIAKVKGKIAVQEALYKGVDDKLDIIISNQGAIRTEMNEIQRNMQDEIKRMDARVTESQGAV